jgi:hypothetical protein
MASGPRRDANPIVAALADAERLVAAARAGSNESQLKDALRHRFNVRRAAIEAVAEPTAEAMRRMIEVMTALLDDGVEHLAVFDNAGHMLLSFAGASMECGFPPGDLPRGASPSEQWHGAVVAHTHPANAGLHGLSPDDLWTYTALRPSRAVVVCEWLGVRHAQTLSAVAGWPDGQMAKGELRDAFIRAKATARAGRWPGEDPMHIALAEVAPRLGLVYTRMKAE